jgi:hypothetical protein
VHGHVSNSLFGSGHGHDFEASSVFRYLAERKYTQRRPAQSMEGSQKGRGKGGVEEPPLSLQAPNLPKHHDGKALSPTEGKPMPPPTMGIYGGAGVNGGINTLEMAEAMRKHA